MMYVRIFEILHNPDGVDGKRVSFRKRRREPSSTCGFPNQILTGKGIYKIWVYRVENFVSKLERTIRRMGGIGFRPTTAAGAGFSI
jgi:hypothetical protein